MLILGLIPVKFLACMAAAALVSYVWAVILVWLIGRRFEG